jgi:hypothetical protein
MSRLEAGNAMPRKSEVQAQIYIATDGQCTGNAKALSLSSERLIFRFSRLNSSQNRRRFLCKSRLGAFRNTRSEF